MINQDNIVIEYLENGNTEYMYFYADNEEHAIEQFDDFFKDYKGDIQKRSFRLIGIN